MHSIFVDGLQNTRAWLSRHFIRPTEDYNTPDRMLKVKNLTTVILNKAYMELINWDGNNVFPEVIKIIIFILVLLFYSQILYFRS